MKQIFYEKDGIPEGYPRRKNRKLNKDCQIVPRYDEKGREIVGITMGNKPKVKLKFRDSMGLLSDIAYELERIDKYSSQLTDFINSCGDEIRGQIKEMNDKNPQAVEFIEQVLLKQAEVWFYLGSWNGMRYASGEKHEWRLFRGFRNMIAKVTDLSLRVEGELLPTSCAVLARSLFA